MAKKKRKSSSKKSSPKSRVQSASSGTPKKSSVSKSSTKSSSPKKVSRRSGMNRGDGLKRWHMVRKEVKRYLEENDLPSSRSDVNGHTTVLYRQIKKQFPSYADNLDLAVVDFFTEDYRKGVSLPTFEWWLLPAELEKLSSLDTIIVNNRDIVTADYFEGTVSEYLLRYSSSFINRINYKYPKRDKTYFQYLHYTKGRVHYFLLLNENSPMLSFDSEEFESWMKKEGIDLSNIAGVITETPVEEIDSEDDLVGSPVEPVVDQLAIEKEKTLQAREKTKQMRGEAFQKFIKEGKSTSEAIDLLNQIFGLD